MQNTPFLPHLTYLTDGGLETTLVFHRGLELRHFAAFELLQDETGREILREYYSSYARLAIQYGHGFIWETPTWRASADWARLMGYSHGEIREINRKAVTFLRALSEEFPLSHSLFSGQIGPRGDGYLVHARMTIAEARKYHLEQMRALALADVDLLCVLTMNYMEEATGIALAARELDVPVIISFTVETDGRLPDGTTLADAIHRTDRATDAYPLHYMINCAHPRHFAALFAHDQALASRVRGIRANASLKSHAELEASETLDIGDRLSLAADVRDLRTKLPDLKVLGGCCGTDHMHLDAICRAWT